MNNNEFFCHGCGLCCTRIDKIKAQYDEVSKETQQVIDEFPYTHKNGRCEMLNDDMSCKVYDSRPTLCNVEEFRKRVSPEMPEWYHNLLQQGGCRQLMRESGKYTEEEIKHIYTRQPRVSGKKNRKI